DAVLDAALTSSSANGLPEIAVSAVQGKFLHLLVASLGAKRVLEVGTLGGYSTIWLARALPVDGELFTLELSEMHAKVAQQNIDRAGLTSKVKILVGPAHESMQQMQPAPSFNFIFINADKQGNKAFRGQMQCTHMCSPPRIRMGLVCIHTEFHRRQFSRGRFNVIC
ncbi:O-methyltransferase, partial [Mycena latifolia]